MSRKIATLWDNKGSDDHERHDHGPEGQAFYAGGSEHSGQQILGPTREFRGGGGGGGGPDVSHLIDGLLDGARQSGALVSNPGESSSDQRLPITFWRNGFTVGEEGELRDYESIENREFMSSIRRGDMPPELASRVRDGMLDVKLENRAREDYKPSGQKFKAFSGEGHRLGAPTPK